MRKRVHFTIAFFVLAACFVLLVSCLIGCTKHEKTTVVDGKEVGVVTLPKGHIFVSAFQKDGYQYVTQEVTGQNQPRKSYLWELSKSSGDVFKPSLLLVFEEQ